MNLNPLGINVHGATTSKLATGAALPAQAGAAPPTEAADGVSIGLDHGHLMINGKEVKDPKKIAATAGLVGDG